MDKSRRRRLNTTAKVLSHRRKLKRIALRNTSPTPISLREHTRRSRRKAQEFRELFRHTTRKKRGRRMDEEIDWLDG